MITVLFATFSLKIRTLSYPPIDYHSVPLREYEIATTEYKTISSEQSE